eukprot:TRINITY_DN2231_c0_g1_i1.p1 TRINITY_DN2231_c0_g1~~TRINITY_DN2231_c0_g1_i1.p1  ORF type:complete len:193 (-),score=46.75 TRINITY_DN2231_c0_g1_i1:20-598(-)
MAHDLAIQQRASARNTAKSSDELVENSKSKRLVTNISEFLAEDNEKLSQLIEQSRHTEKRHSEKRSKRRSRRKKHKHHRENSFSVRITVSDEETEDIPMGGTFPISRRSLSPREVEEQQSHDVLTPLPEIVIQKQSRMRRDTGPPKFIITEKGSDETDDTREPGIDPQNMSSSAEETSLENAVSEITQFDDI